ncbi:hypothetical protein [Paraburkholderia hospita]|uniref:hypothetical protein n=1 Tax=Paraburkholderia hospita TaxID=169430 RepID=UPI0009C9FA8C|nr:hypothetical protein [Paraburkholderia hospita]SKC74339.1 hypothetical protein SAMN05446934_2783 [Paraburkholderia hospita]
MAIERRLIIGRQRFAIHGLGSLTTSPELLVHKINAFRVNLQALPHFARHSDTVMPQIADSGHSR